MDKQMARLRDTLEGERVAATSLGTLLAQRNRILYPLISILVFWQILTFFFPSYLVPSIVAIVSELGSIVTDRFLLINYFFTVYRVLTALIVSFLIAISLSTLVSYSPGARDFWLTILHFMMGVPALSWVVIAAIWFANVEFRIFFIVFVAALPMFVVQIDDGIRAVDKDLIEMMKIFRPTRGQLLHKLILPSILQSILTSWKIALGYGTRVVIVAELVGASVGVGNRLMRAQEVFRMESAIAWTLMLVFFLLITEGTIVRIESYALRYRPAKTLT